MARDARPEPEGGAAVYGFDRRRTWPFMAMLLALLGLGVGRLALGEGASVPAMLVLIGFPLTALVMVGWELRLRGPVVVIAEAGLLDRRLGEAVVPWDRIAEAEAKRRAFVRGVRIRLVDGSRYDLELALLRAEPVEVTTRIRAMAERATAEA